MWCDQEVAGDPSQGGRKGFCKNNVKACYFLFAESFKMLWP